eukprot:COSAG06_NODE_26868_length_606_cov_0.593688_1_plen_166_part_10
MSDPVCYSDVNSTRTLSSANWQWQGYPLTPEFCAWQCHQLNFSLAGTEYRTECYCGNALSGQSEVLTPDHCRMPCSGKANKTAAADETCGGDRAMSVYKVDCSGSAVPPPCWSNGTDGPPPPPDPGNEPLNEMSNPAPAPASPAPVPDPRKLSRPEVLSGSALPLP